MTITVDSAAVGTTTDPSSSASGSVITLVPRQGGYVNVVAKVTGVAGLNPTFSVTLTNGVSGWAWSTTVDTAFFSEDGGYTWYPGVAPDYASSPGNVILQAPAAFTSNTVWFARMRREGSAQLLAWVQANAALYPSLYSNVSGGSGYVAATFTPQTDELGRTQATGSPLIAHWLRKGGGGKRTFILTSGLAAGEDWGTTVFRRSIDFLAAQNVPETVALLNNFDFIVAPLVNSPGRDTGCIRNQWRDGGADPNRLWTNITVTQVIDYTRTMFDANWSNVAGMLDWQGAFGASNATQYWYTTNGSSQPPLNTNYGNALTTRIGAIGGGFYSGSAGNEIDGSGYVTEYGFFTKGAALSSTVECNHDWSTTDASAVNQGKANIYALYDRAAAGDWGALVPSSGYGNPFCRRRV